MTDYLAAPYSCQKMRAAVLAAGVLVFAGLLSGCGTRSAHSASPLSCLKAAGLSNAKAHGSTTWYAIPPGVQGSHVLQPKVFINRYPTTAKASDAAMMAPSVYSLAAGRYTVTVGMRALIRDRHFVEAVASCLRRISAEHAVAANVLAEDALRSATGLGDPAPTSIVYVQSQRQAANTLVSGDVVDSNQKVDVVLATGTFDATKSGPPGRKGPRITGDYLVVIVDDQTGEILDSGLLKSRPDLGHLGVVQPLSR